MDDAGQGHEKDGPQARHGLIRTHRRQQMRRGIGEIHRQQKGHVDGVAPEQVADGQIVSTDPDRGGAATSSGAEVAAATKATPTKVWPRPVTSASSSPVAATMGPLMRTTVVAATRRRTIQVIDVSFLTDHPVVTGVGVPAMPRSGRAWRIQTTANTYPTPIKTVSTPTQPSSRPVGVRSVSVASRSIRSPPRRCEHGPG